LPNDEFSKKVNCLQRNAIKFEVPEQFETAMLDNVYEHIAKSDKQFFLNSVSNSIKPGGKLILIIPHKAFGPSDWTSLIDNSFSGKLASHCVHLDETTFSDTILELKKHGFIKFYSPIPFIAFTGLRNYFSNLRLPSSWFAYIENNKFILNFLKLFKYKNRSFFRMQVIIVAEKQ
jgi:SAM-dependent methyltransferase